MNASNIWNFVRSYRLEKATISRQTPLTRHVLWINSQRVVCNHFLWSICHHRRADRQCKFFLIKRSFAAHLNHTTGATMNTFQYPDRRSIHLHHKSTHSRPNSKLRLQSATPSSNRTRRRWVRHLSTNTATQASYRARSSPHIKTCWATVSSGTAEAALMAPPIWVHTKPNFARQTTALCNDNNTELRSAPEPAWRV